MLSPLTLRPGRAADLAGSVFLRDLLVPAFLGVLAADLVDLPLQHHHLLQAALYALDVVDHFLVARSHLVEVLPYLLQPFVRLLLLQSVLRLELGRRQAVAAFYCCHLLAHLV